MCVCVWERGKGATELLVYEQRLSINPHHVMSHLNCPFYVRKSLNGHFYFPLLFKPPLIIKTKL